MWARIQNTPTRCTATHLNGPQVLTGFLKCSPGSDSAFSRSLETTLIFFRLFVSRLIQAPSYLERGQWTPPFVIPLPASGACALTFAPSVPQWRHLPRETEKHSVANIPLFDLKWMIYSSLRKVKQRKSRNECESLFPSWRSLERVVYPISSQAKDLELLILKIR